MSANRECEEVKVGAVNAEPSALLNCVDDTRSAMSAKDYGTSLAAFNKDLTSSLPLLELLDAKADVPPPPEFKQVGTSDKELATEGIKREHVKDDRGGERTTTDFPNGVKVSTTPGGETTLDNGHKVKLMPSIEIQPDKPVHEHPKGSGEFVDKDNKEVFKTNKDGSYTVFTDKGAYTARDDGTVTKEAAIHTPDGWIILNTKDPLGGLKLDDTLGALKLEDKGFTIPSVDNGELLSNLSDRLPTSL